MSKGATHEPVFRDERPARDASRIMILDYLYERRTDLPLEKDASRRFLPWLVALNVLLATLALAGLMIIGDAAQRWGRGLTGTLTVQVPPANQDDPAAAAAETQARVARAIEVLRATPGVAEARALDRKELSALMEPWLGSGELLRELPLPSLIDVRLKDGGAINVAGLEAVVAAVAPGATIDDHKKWLDRLILLAQTIKAIAAVIVVLIGGAAVGTVIFITRTGLSLHHEVIELLHVMGAHDNYVARQFQSQALGLCAKGGVIGFGLAAVTLLVLGVLVDRLGSQLLPPIHITPVQWLILLALPVAVSLIGMLTARIIVLRSLAKLL